MSPVGISASSRVSVKSVQESNQFWYGACDGSYFFEVPSRPFVLEAQESTMPDRWLQISSTRTCSVCMLRSLLPCLFSLAGFL